MRTAADDLDAVLEGVGDLERLLLILDFDGTLAPIVERPARAGLADGAREVLRAAAERTTVTVLSGRPVSDLAPRLEGLPVTLSGGHGAEIRLPDGTHTLLVDPGECAPVLDAVHRELTDLLAGTTSFRLERKPASLAVHYRQAGAGDLETTLPEVRRRLVRHATSPPGFELLEGHEVTELRPAGVDKGAAVRWLIDHHPGKLPLAVGDDVTDEDAFRAAVTAGGEGVLVAAQPRESAARWRLDGPGRVVQLLAALCDRTRPGPEG